MPSGRLNALLASTSFRLSLVCAAVIVIAFAMAGFGAWFVTRSAAEQAGRERILLEMASLQLEARENGLDAAIAEIARRQRAPGALEYRLVDAAGRELVGELDISATLGWSTLYLDPPSEGAASPDLLLLNQPIAGGGNLIIAEDLERTEWVRYAMLRTLLWIAVAALLVSVGAGYLAARGALRRMDHLFSAMTRVGGGDLSARLPVRPNASDVDLLSRRINAMLERIETLVSSLRRVSSDIAHDLRTPITHVRQQLDYVSDAQSLDAAKAAALVAQSKIDDLMRVFSATLRLAEIEGGSAHARFATLNLGDLIERVADAYRPDIEGAGGTLILTVTKEVIIDGDPDLLAQALANLLDNAVSYAPSGGTIIVSLHTDRGGAVLGVQDRGPGVPVADRHRVLEPFVRLDRSRATSGAGLGLSIVHAIARLHGAELRLEDARPGLRVELAWPTRAPSQEG